MTPDDLSERLAAFERCVLDRDVEVARDVLDDGYALVVTHPSPATMPLDRWLQVLPDYTVHDYVVELQQVDLNEDVAAVLSLVRMRATALGQDRSGRFVLSDVWRLRDGAWRIWRRHSTPLSAGPMPGVEKAPA